jgi:transmembrane 9 superfamily protein 3
MAFSLRCASVLSLLFCGFLAGVPVLADDQTHTYKDKEAVVLWLNTVGPFHNPQETYPFHSLPFCKDAREDGQRFKNSHGMGEILEGNVLKDSGIQIQFGVNVPVTKLCSMKLDTKKADRFALAVKHHYWYQMYIDDLPLWAMVGEELTDAGAVVSNEEYMAELEEHGEDHMKLAHEKYRTNIFTMKTISIAKNGNQIIEVNVTSAEPVPIQDDVEVQFAYSVTWVDTDMPFGTRFDRYLDNDFFEHRIHWFSIMNSFMMVIFLCGVVALILIRTLRNDFAKYTRDDDDLDSLDRGMGDESGWKQVHGDVFRPPPFVSLYAALLGTGYQLAVIAGMVICLAASGGAYEERGSITSAFIGCYAVSSIVAGFTSGSYYAQCFYPQPAANWVRTMMLTVLFLPGMVFGVMFCLNFIAVYFGTVSMMPVGTLFQLILIWACVSFPLSVTGTILVSLRYCTMIQRG